MALAKLEIRFNDRAGAIEEVRNFLESKNLKVATEDLERPWGFFYYINPSQTDNFINQFFGDVDLVGINTSLPLQPKILVFEPGKMNSWQYHHRRAEIWRVLSPSLQVVMSRTDEQTEPKTIVFSDVINFPQGTRHRGGAPKDSWGVAAEIWQHTDLDNPSDEDDIVRLADDFGRAD